MKHALNTGTIGVLAVLFCLAGVTVPSALAQGREKVAVKKVDVRRDLRTPDYNGVHADNRASPMDNWLACVLDYITMNGTGKDSEGKPGWQDEVTVEWSVLLRRKDAKPILMHRSVTYVDLDDRRPNHYADVYVRPGFIKRYVGGIQKRDVLVCVQIKIAGRTEALWHERDTEYKDLKWWDWEPPKVEVRDEELLTRDETPFAPLDYDFFEQVKPKSASK